MKKALSLNPFPMTNLRSDIESLHLLRMRRHYFHVWNKRYWTDCEFARTLSL